MARQLFDDAIDVIGVMQLVPAVTPHVLERCPRVVEPALVVPEDGAGLVGHPGKLRHVVGERAEARLALALCARGVNPLRRLDHDGEHADGVAPVVPDGAVVEVEPDVLWRSAPVELKVLVLVGERAATEHDLHYVAVEIGDLGPALQHGRSQELGMAAAGELRIGVVVDHDAVRSPQQHHGHGRGGDDVDGRLEALRPRTDLADAGRGPVEGRDERFHFVERHWCGDARVVFGLPGHIRCADDDRMHHLLFFAMPAWAGAIPVQAARCETPGGTGTMQSA